MPRWRNIPCNRSRRASSLDKKSPHPMLMEMAFQLDHRMKGLDSKTRAPRDSHGTIHGGHNWSGLYRLWFVHTSLSFWGPTTTRNKPSWSWSQETPSCGTYHAMCWLSFLHRFLSNQGTSWNSYATNFKHIPSPHIKWGTRYWNRSTMGKERSRLGLR